MPTQYNMDVDQDLYRGILAYEFTPTKHIPNPDFNPNHVMRGYVPSSLRVPAGPEETKTVCIGPYTSVSPIRSYITRNRDHYKNLRLVRIEKVSGWEEVK